MCKQNSITAISDYLFIIIISGTSQWRNYGGIVGADEPTEANTLIGHFPFHIFNDIEETPSKRKALKFCQRWSWRRGGEGMVCFPVRIRTEPTE